MDEDTAIVTANIHSFRLLRISTPSFLTGQSFFVSGWQN